MTTLPLRPLFFRPKDDRYKVYCNSSVKCFSFRWWSPTSYLLWYEQQETGNAESISEEEWGGRGAWPVWCNTNRYSGTEQNIVILLPPFIKWYHHFVLSESICMSKTVTPACLTVTADLYISCMYIPWVIHFQHINVDHPVTLTLTLWPWMTLLGT